MNNFTEEAWAAFQEAAAEKYDFTKCQRSDGSIYGTSGECRKGKETKTETEIADAKDFRYIGKKGKAHVISDGVQEKHLYGKEYTNWARQALRGA